MTTLPEFGGDLGLTPPPADGSVRDCPSCVNGCQYIGGLEEGEVRCADCFGSGVQGTGWTQCRAAERDPVGRS